MRHTLQAFLRWLRRPLVVRILTTTTHVATTVPAVALTFDDGPDAAFTPQVLEVLRRYDARATFFMIGALAAKYPQLVEAVALGGHAIANHSWDHCSFPQLSHRQRLRQIQDTARVLAPYEVKLFRPPFGDQNTESAITSRLLHYRTVMWSGHAEDWRHHTPAELTDKLVKSTRPGAIFLLHDGLVPLHGSHEDRTDMLIALAEFIQRMRHDYQFVTLPELFKLGTPQQQPWYRVEKRAWVGWPQSSLSDTE